MSTDTTNSLLHNMSAPPKSVVAYAGLSDLFQDGGPDLDKRTSLQIKNDTLFGTPVRFTLDEEWRHLQPRVILARLGVKPEQSPGVDPARQLTLLIDRRANELPLPEGCAVIPESALHSVLSRDPLTVLTILCKSSDTVWLRTKTPSLFAPIERSSVTLLIPIAFASRIPEVKR